MMNVIDASAMTHMLLETPAGVKLVEAIDFSDMIGVPDLFAFEMTNVFWKYVQAGKLDIDHANNLLTQALDAVDLAYPAYDQRQEVLSEAARLGHSAYDLFYFVTARRSGGLLITCDHKLATLAAENGVRVLDSTEL